MKAGSGADTLGEIRARADIVEVVGAHVRLRRGGRNFVGLCPFHTEKTPSFSVRPDRGYFHCFGCGASGSAFDFVMRIEGLTFAEAVHALARRYGVALPERNSGGPGAKAREKMLQAAEVAAAFFSHVLWNTREGAPARDYIRRRGVDSETAHQFALGFAAQSPASLANALRKRGLLEVGAQIGLVRRSTDGEQDMFRGRLIFPIRDTQGRPVAFGGRVLDDRLPKYINSPESPLYSKARTLYGLFEARRAIATNDRAILVEGYIDVIALSQAGFRETVASLGTSLTVEQLKLLSRNTRNVLACFDGDDAGHKASLRALEVFLAASLLGKGVFLPDGLDPDTLIRERGARAFAELVESAELLVDYFLRIQTQEAKASLSARAIAAERVAEMLRLIRNPFEFDLVARKGAALLGVSEELLRSQARRRQPGASARGGPPAKPEIARKEASPTSEEEIGLLAIALEHPELRGEVSTALPLAENRAVADLLGEVCRSTLPPAELEQLTREKLSSEQFARLGEFIVGSLIDELAPARQLGRAYIATLERRRQLREVEALTREAATSSGDRGAAAAQEVIARRREGEARR